MTQLHTATPAFLDRSPHGPAPTGRVVVDLARLQRNARALTRWLGPGTGLCGVVKKDGYGLGAPAVAEALVASGASVLAVWSLDEARRLADANVRVPMLVLSPVRRLSRTDRLYRVASQGGLHLTIHDADQLRTLEESGQRQGIVWPVHLFVDTGMSRGGLSVEAYHASVARLPHLRHVRAAGVCSHFACADSCADTTDAQAERFAGVLAETCDRLPGDVAIHLANSCGTLRDRRHHLDLVRPGLMVLGYAQAEMRGERCEDAPVCRPVLRWAAPLLHTQVVAKGGAVGYGGTHELKRDSLLGLVPVGYADGYPVSLSNRGVTRVLDHDGHALGEAPVVGRVNMDQLVVDLSDCAVPGDWQRVEVELIGDDPAGVNDLNRLALQADTVPYELLCRVAPGQAREYVR